LEKAQKTSIFFKKSRKKFKKSQFFSIFPNFSQKIFNFSQLFWTDFSKKLKKCKKVQKK